MADHKERYYNWLKNKIKHELSEPEYIEYFYTIEFKYKDTLLATIQTDGSLTIYWWWLRDFGGEYLIKDEELSQIVKKLIEEKIDRVLF